ncbi:MAG: conjugal transfer protein TraX [Propionibacteriaceae bacterium]|jgi:hypothetical protein|nr:conjugal transfer protein TraX [Propionibacteriaceae bacterium]
MATEELSVKGLSDFKLKVIALILLCFGIFSTSVVGHGIVLLGAGATANDIPLDQLTIYVVTEILSWTALPIYAWLLLSGFEHTSSLKNYVLRLLVLALITEPLYDFSVYGTAFDMRSQNPVWALLISLAVLYFFRYLRGSQMSKAQQVLGCVLVSLAAILWLLIFNVYTRFGFFPGGIVLFLFVIIFATLRSKVNTMMMTAGFVGALCVVTPAMGLVILHFRNNELGMGPMAERVFYFLYPMLLLLFSVYGVTGF